MRPCCGPERWDRALSPIWYVDLPMRPDGFPFRILPNCGHYPIRQDQFPRLIILAPGYLRLPPESGSSCGNPCDLARSLSELLCLSLALVSSYTLLCAIV